MLTDTSDAPKLAEGNLGRRYKYTKIIIILRMFSSCLAHKIVRYTYFKFKLQPSPKVDLPVATPLYSAPNLHSSGFLDPQNAVVF